MKCPKCGANARGRFCSECGAVLPEPDPEKKEWLELRRRGGAFTSEVYKDKAENDYTWIARDAWGMAKTIVDLRDDSIRKHAAKPGTADAVEREARLLYPLLRDHIRERMSVLKETV